MTDLQNQTIRKLRIQGISCKEISGKTGISLNTVKSYCKRNGIVPENRQKTEEQNNNESFCRNCGKPIIKRGKKPQKFCSRECGLLWWHTHADSVNRKAWYSITCSGCGKNFSSYGNKNRKYCSHQCYINARFGGSENEIK